MRNQGGEKGLIGSTNNQWGHGKPPLIEVSLYLDLSVYGIIGATTIIL